MTGNGSFAALLRAEWTKLCSVRRWVVALAALVLLSVGLSVLVASGSATDVNAHHDFAVGWHGRPVSDEFQFVHRTLSGDGSIVARVLSQEDSHAGAGAGVMVKDGLTGGARYAALFVTPRRGLRLSANFTEDRPVGASGAPRWLRLTRTGATVTAAESTDGTTWRTVGQADLGALPYAVEVGVFVSSPPEVRIARRAGGVSVGGHPTAGAATFDSARVDGASGGPWRADPVTRPKPSKPEGPAGVSPGSATIGEVITVRGSGEIGPREQPDDPVQIVVFGMFAGLIVAAVLGVLYVTSEYRRGMVRTTFAATPRRGRVLAAKAVVLGSTAFALAVAATSGSFVLAMPRVLENGFGPPAFPRVSLADPPVLRVVLLTAAFVALVAVFSLAVGSVVRHSAGAVTIVLALVVLPPILAAGLPETAARWVIRLTPAAGLATQRAKPPSNELAEPWAALGPWEGIATVAVYAAGALVLAAWQLRRRDV